ncbi:hypothetical protein ACQUQU_07695 [Thalassolituus sp. LLYu03]|uniref:hypothetical protein n=1 Tax=Thalassolituus sp. LLYu03 TaxID=3421656 RepID=UPI003D2930DB
MLHLQLSRGTISLTERILRKGYATLANYLRNAMLATEQDTIDLLLSTQQLADIHSALESLQNGKDFGLKSMSSHLRERWQQALMPV